MEQSKIDMFLMVNQKYFPEEKINCLKEKMKNTENEKYPLLCSIRWKNPSTYLLISVFFGGCVVDRFMLGDIGMGLVKLFTLGGCGILTILDWCSTKAEVKERNYKHLLSIIA